MRQLMKTKNDGETDFFRKDRLIDRVRGIRHNDTRMNENGQLVKGVGEMDARGFVTGVTNAVGGTAVSAYAYAHDRLGRILSRNGDAFGYSRRSEVVSASVASNAYSYDYDSAGNVTLASRNAETNLYTANARNQCVAVAGASPSLPSYDADGNLSAFDGFSLWWDAAGRLLSAVSGEGETQYEYDWLGRRITAWNGGDTVRDFVWDGWLPVAEHLRDAWTGEDLAVTRYVWGADLSGSPQGAGGIGGLLAVERGGVWYAPLYDANGNVTAYIDESGNTVAQYTYDAFGNTISQSGALADAFPFRFSTRYFDAETGFYYYGLRHYSPKWGRWISRDPIGGDGGPNLYAFCANDPVNGVDPLGMFKVNAVNFSPRYSSKSDFWLGVYLDLLDNESDGYIKVYKKIKIDLTPCGGGSGKPKESEIVTYVRLSQKRSTNEKLMYTIAFPEKASERVYIELASLGTYNYFCGTISFKFELGFARSLGISEFGTNATDENLFGSLDERRALSYYKVGKNPLSFLSSASFEGTLKYTCNLFDNVKLIDVKTSKNWTRSDFDRLGKNQATRTATELEDYNAKSFPYD